MYYKIAIFCSARKENMHMIQHEHDLELKRVHVGTHLHTKYIKILLLRWMFTNRGEFHTVKNLPVL
jgi:hypothetical protein